MQLQIIKNVLINNPNNFGALYEYYPITVLLIILVISKPLTFASGQFTASDPSIKVHFGPIQKGKLVLPS